jgi:serine/threonine protein kinase
MTDQEPEATGVAGAPGDIPGPSAEAVELIGSVTAGKYRILRLIGRGGMGAVYEAEHVTIGRRFAIKFVDRRFANDETVTRRFEREARAASAIESEHIVSVFDFGSDDGRPYIVMELLRGEDLGSRLARLGTIDVGEALHIAAQVLRGLARAHAAGIVHRDLKPDNVLLAPEEDDPVCAKLVDFGISKMAGLDGPGSLALTQNGIVLGTPLFMSPEQAAASPDTDARSDLYSVGAMLYECLSGRPPHVGETPDEILTRIRTTDAPSLQQIAPSVSAPVAAFVARALRRDPSARFQTATEMLAALRAIAPDEPAAAPMKAVGARQLELAKTIIDGGVPAFAVDCARTSQSTGAPRSRLLPSGRAIRVAALALVATLTGVAVTVMITSRAESGAESARASQALSPVVSTPSASAASEVPVAVATVTRGLLVPSSRVPAPSAPAPSEPSAKPAPPKVRPSSRPLASSNPTLDITRDLPP